MRVPTYTGTRVSGVPGQSAESYEGDLGAGAPAVSVEWAVSDERKLAVLRAIVEDYVATGEPVGSKALVERHHLGVSSATVRNDMAALEEEGLISAPHTSAGRIPTDQGYRLFVDRLSQVKPLSGPERRAIQTFLDGAVDLEDVMGRTVRLLAHVTHQVALVQYPILNRSSVRHVELVPISATRVLLVLITDTGRVEQRTIETAVGEHDAVLAELRSRLNTQIVGKRLTDVPSAVEHLIEAFPVGDRKLVDAVLGSLLETVIERPEERVVLGGTANLTRVRDEFPLTLQPVLEALEEQVVLLRLLGEVTSPDNIHVRIGSENSVEGLSATSVVSVGYGRGDEAFAQIGVLGPTRMDYPGTMGALQAVARYVGRALSE